MGNYFKDVKTETMDRNSTVEHFSFLIVITKPKIMLISPLQNISRKCQHKTYFGSSSFLEIHFWKLHEILLLMQPSRTFKFSLSAGADIFRGFSVFFLKAIAQLKLLKTINCSSKSIFPSSFIRRNMNCLFVSERKLYLFPWAP